MPRIYTTSFDIHHSELDTFGELRASTYARLLQQAATEASIDAGYPEAWYDETGTFWLVRRTAIDYRSPLRPRDILHVRTWVADFRRVRSLRTYELFATDEQVPVAHAHTDWVYVHRASGRPQRIPPGMIDRFMPAGEPLALSREPRANGRLPDGAFVGTRTVEFRDIDALAHVNNAAYLDYVEQAALDACAAAGWPLERLGSLGGHWRSRSHDIEYLTEARYGDRLHCVTWVTAQDDAGIERRSEIRRAVDDCVLARARSRWVWVSHGTGEPTTVPLALATALAAT
jgi:acyl-CoA thioester hydrolase